jgi:hypothetical protein
MHGKPRDGHGWVYRAYDLIPILDPIFLRGFISFEMYNFMIQIRYHKFKVINNMTQCEHPFQCGSSLHNNKIWFVGRLCLAHVTYSYNFHGGIRHFGKQAQILKSLALSLIIAPNTSQDYFVVSLTAD